ncbi:hypothetical protein Tco_0285367 [Tanacetum coccineum]
MHIRMTPSFFLTNIPELPRAGTGPINLSRMLAFSCSNNILPFRKRQSDKVPVLQVRHQYKINLKTPPCRVGEDPASPQEILQESLELLFMLLRIVTMWVPLPKDILGASSQRPTGCLFPKIYWVPLPKDLLGASSQRPTGHLIDIDDEEQLTDRHLICTIRTEDEAA